MVQTLSAPPLTFCPLFLTAVSAHVPPHLGSSLSVSVDAGLDSCAPRAHMAVMVTPRTHCHFTMQARSLRVPELCDDHTTPSCLVVNSLEESKYRSVNTLVLPDPSSTQWGLVTFLACALHKPFVRSCDFAHHGLYCSHVCACTHTTARCSISLFGVCPRCFSVLTWKNIRTRGCLVAPQGGITLTTRASRTPHTHSLQQLQSGASCPPSVQTLASKREPHGAATPSSVSCPQVTHSAVSPQVQTGPTRTVTSDLNVSHAR